MKAGSFSPNRAATTVHAMAADDLPLYFDMENLTEKQKADHYDQNRLIAMLQMALLSISKPEDHVAVFEEFNEAPWDGFLKQHHDMMSAVGYPMVPLDHIIFSPMPTYYESLRGRLPDVELLNFLMMSRSNEVLHQDQAAIDLMLKLNTKFHFAEHAPGFGISTPDTLIAKQPLAGNPEARTFFEKHGNRIILKMTGQPGSRSVKAVGSLGEAEDYLTAYDREDPVLLQQRLDLDRYVEWTADLEVTKTDVKLDNIRRILVRDGLWIGNLLPFDNPLSDEQEATLLTLGRYAQSFGFGSTVGNNLGIDYFVGPEGEIIITEINPRWTAGLFPTEALRRDDRKGQDAVAHFELIAVDQYAQFLDFIRENLPGQGSEAWSVMHLGFSPFNMAVDDTPCVYCWLIILGDFTAYRDAASALLGPPNMRNGNLIVL